MSEQEYLPAKPKTREERRRERAEKKNAERVKKQLSMEALKQAHQSGMLPHEILLSAARGEPFEIRHLEIERYESGPLKGEISSQRWVIELYYPDFKEQIDAAKAAAPYFTPRLSAQAIKDERGQSEKLTLVLNKLGKELPG